MEFPSTLSEVILLVKKKKKNLMFGIMLPIRVELTEIYSFACMHNNCKKKKKKLFPEYLGIFVPKF